jgi:hypothetical protein
LISGHWWFSISDAALRARNLLMPKGTAVMLGS